MSLQTKSVGKGLRLMTEMIGIIGGTGLSALFAGEIPWAIPESEETPFGKASARVQKGQVHGVEVLFISRHGPQHTIAPHEVNYRANIWALKEAGASRIIAVSAVGSLQENIHPGDMVVPRQMIDFTRGRETSFLQGGLVGHLSAGDPFCVEFTDILWRGLAAAGVLRCYQGTYICINGPRFSTKAESQLFRSWGAQVIGMTMAPEAFLAKEAGMCYGAICAVTDYDVWREGEEVTTEEVLKTMSDNLGVILSVIPKALEIALEAPRDMSLHPSIEGAIVTAQHDQPEDHPVREMI